MTALDYDVTEDLPPLLSTDEPDPEAFLGFQATLPSGPRRPSGHSQRRHPKVPKGRCMMFNCPDDADPGSPLCSYHRGCIRGERSLFAER